MGLKGLDVSRSTVAVLRLAAALAVLASCGHGASPTTPDTTLPTPMPVTEVEVRTAHFLISFPVGNERYHAAVARFLERAYGLYQSYTGQDVNALSGHSYYLFGYRLDDWHWGSLRMGDFGGLSTAGGPSAVRAAYLPQSLLPLSATPNWFAAFSLHELGNGWWRVLNNASGDSPLPWWFDDEGHSGFLRSEAELDMGYCADAQAEYARHYADFYLECRQEGGTRCGVEARLVSLRHKYGWEPFRQLYAAVQSGSLDDLVRRSETERSGAAAVLLSEAVGESLVDFLARDGIEVDAASRERLRGLPRADVPFLTQVACR